MTTIVYQNGLMVSDGLVIEGGRMIYEDLPKVRCIITGLDQYLVGFAGALGMMAAFHDWATLDFDPEYTPEISALGSEFDYFEAIVVKRSTGTALLYENCHAIDLAHRAVCIGSGSDMARAALELNYSPVEAVKFASKFDLATNNKTFTETFTPALYEAASQCS